MGRDGLSAAHTRGSAVNVANGQAPVTRRLRRVWFAFATFAGILVLVVGAATLLGFGRFAWISYPAPISVWNNTADPLNVGVTGTGGGATYTVPAYGLVTLAIPVAVGDVTRVRVGGDCFAEIANSGGSFQEGGATFVAPDPNEPSGPLRCGSPSGPIEGLQIIQPDPSS